MDNAQRHEPARTLPCSPSHPYCTRPSSLRLLLLLQSWPPSRLSPSRQRRPAHSRLTSTRHALTSVTDGNRYATRRSKPPPVASPVLFPLRNSFPTLSVSHVHAPSAGAGGADRGTLHRQLLLLRLLSLFSIRSPTLPHTLPPFRAANEAGRSHHGLPGSLLIRRPGTEPTPARLRRRPHEKYRTYSVLVLASRARSIPARSVVVVEYSAGLIGALLELFTLFLVSGALLLRPRVKSEEHVGWKSTAQRAGEPDEGDKV
ncbi:hypothetical protein CDD83_10705 [Cordyceps sp. RAO-2017]|nr:hypothetical protein CDD83_10705 [Cordyceps sp. RAO-2017]